MYNNLKLAVKIGGGFAVLVVLTIGISLVSVLNLQTIRDASTKDELVTMIMADSLFATIAGKDYVILKDLAAQKRVETFVAQVIQEASQVRDMERAAEQKEFFTNIIKGTEAYGDFLAEYASLEAKKTVKAGEMEGNRYLVVQILLGLHESQLAYLVDRAGSGTSIVKSNAIRINRILEAYELLTDIQFNLQMYLNESDKTYITALTDIIARIVVIFEDLRPQLVQQNLQGEIDKANTFFVLFEKQLVEYVAFTDAQEEARSGAATAGSKTVEYTQTISDFYSRAVENLILRTIFVVLIVMSIALVFGVLMAMFITRNITRAMAKGVQFASEIAEGNLDVELDVIQTDEIGQLGSALQRMLIKISAIVEDVNRASAQVAAGSQQLSNTSQDMSQGATEQAASVEEISSSMEQMSANIKQNADNALQTEKVAQKSAQAAEDGGKAVGATLVAMKEIASKIGIIEEIARSTNMLALNASIEAARAGEYGKGFAVVAAEVGKLAERSQKEAGEISRLSIESVSIAEQAGVTIAEMIPDIKRTADLVQEINASSQEQNSGAEQINAAILQLDNVVQRNASTSEESAAMAEELATQADQLTETMRFFRVKNNDQDSVSRKLSITDSNM